MPKSIATKELLPELQADPSELFRRNMEVLAPEVGVIDPWNVDWWVLSEEFFPYRLRQRPGPGNALGDVKFMFPNKHHVYLHDTPHRNLFSKDRRAYSHGCVRVQDPVLFAETLLSAQTTDPLELYDRLRYEGAETQVNLKRSVPVHIMYRTIWLDENGEMQMRPDVYGRDALVAAALRKAGLSLKPVETL